MIRYCYHDSFLNKERLEKGVCRCQTDHAGRVFILHELIVNEVIVDPYNKENALCLNSVVPAEAEEAYRPAQYIYAISEDFEIRIALDCDRNYNIAVKHETLFSNADVLAAGEIFFKQGYVSDINDSSGSYGTRGALITDPLFAEVLVKAIETHNIPVKPDFFQRLSDILESA